MTMLKFTIIRQISTHTLTWSVTISIRLQGSWRNFNSHAHVERDPLRSAWLLAHPHFNSHAHVERDEQMTPAINALSGHFNSHAHVERDGGKI